MEAFDADVLICSVGDDVRGAEIRRTLFAAEERIGSNLLLLELLMKPMRTDASDELALLAQLLSVFDLKPVDNDVAEAALGFSVKYGLKLADAIQLGTAVVWGAERFHTNNRKDFGPHITEVEVVHAA